MQIPDRLFRVLTNSGLLNRFIFLLPDNHELLIKYPKLIESHIFERQAILF